MRIGLVGIGTWGRIIANKLKQSDVFELISVCDRNSYDLFWDIVYKKDIQVIYIATQPKYHFDISVKAIKSGCDVILEKPPTGNADDLNKLIYISKELNKNIYVNNLFTASPTLSKIKNLCKTPNRITSKRYNTKESSPDISMISNMLYHDLYIFYELFGRFPTNIKLENNSKLVFDEGWFETSYSSKEKVREMYIYSDDTSLLWDDVQDENRKLKNIITNEYIPTIGDTIDNKLKQIHSHLVRNKKDNSIVVSLMIMNLFKECNV